MSGHIHPRLQVARVTLIVETDDQVIAWQASQPDDADVQIDTHIAAPRWDSLQPRTPRRAPATSRIEIGVTPGEEGYLVAHGRAQVSLLLRSAGLVLKPGKCRGRGN